MLLLCLSIVQAAPGPAPPLPDGHAKPSSSALSAESVALINDYLAHLQYQNKWDEKLTKDCDEKSGFYLVQSKHDNYREDRLWEFQCRKVVSKCSDSPTCTKTESYINEFNEVISFMCGKNGYIAGVESYHDNSKEDRRWKFTCCSVPFYTTTDCRLTDYVNKLDGEMDFQADDDEVITGVFSYYSSRTRYACA